MYSINLRKLREKKDLNRKWVAAKIGVSYTTLTCYETGRTEPDFRTVIILCQLYGYFDLYKLLTEEIML